MKLLLENWRKFLKEDFKIREEYPREFKDFLAEIEKHKDDIWVVFDTETTGLMYKEDYVQPTQIACVAFNTNGFMEGTTPEIVNNGIFNVKVKLQEKTIARKNAELEDSDLSDFPITKIFKMTRYGDKTAPFISPEEAIERFETYLSEISAQAPSGNITMIAKNSPFDRGIIATSYNRLGRQMPNYNLWDANAVISQYLHPVVMMMKTDENGTDEDKRIANRMTTVNKASGEERLSTSLGELINVFDVQNKGWHDALADIHMTMSVLENIINYIRRVLKNKQVDFSKVEPFDPRAGDPYGEKKYR